MTTSPRQRRSQLRWPWCNKRGKVIHRSQIKDFLASKLAVVGPKSLTKNTVRNIHATLRAMLRAAVDDGLLTSNPAEKLGRQLRLITPKVTRQENIKSMTRDQRQRFLAQAEEDSPHLYHSSLRDLGRYRHAARGGGCTSMERY